jgi:acyl carrier protein
MQRPEIERQIRSFLVNNFLFGKDEALDDNAALLGGVIDSTGVIELVMFLQEHFSIVVEDEEVASPETFESLKNVAAFVEGKLRARAASNS